MYSIAYTVIYNNIKVLEIYYNDKISSIYVIYRYLLQKNKNNIQCVEYMIKNIM